MLQAMVAGLFGCLLLLVGTCSAWHDSHHGERRAFSEPLPFHILDFLCRPRSWMAGLPGQLQGRAPPPKVLLERISFVQQKFLFFIQGGTWSPVPSSLCQAKTIRTEPGTSGILQVGLPFDLFQTWDDVFQGETGFPTIWTPSSWWQLRSKTGGCKRGGERGWNIILKLKCFGFTFHWWNIAGPDTGETTGGSAWWIKPGRWWEFYLTEDVPSLKSFDCLFSVI